MKKKVLFPSFHFKTTIQMEKTEEVAE